MCKWPMTYFLSFLIVGLSLAQRDVTTLSGQKFILYSNSTWEKASENTTLVDTLSKSTINNLSTVGLSETEIGFINAILEAAQNKEIESFLALDHLDKELAINQIATHHAKSSKDKKKEKILRNEMKILKDKISALNVQYQKIAKDISDIKNLGLLKSKNRSAKIKTYQMVYLPSYQSLQPNNALKEESKEKIVAASQQIAMTYPDEMTDCSLAIDTKINKIRHLATATSLFFTYTPVRLKSYFKEKELMNVHIHLEKWGKQHQLVLTAKIISKDAAKNYGTIQKDDIMKISFITGKSLILTATDYVQPVLETYTGNSIFTIKYKIDKDAIDLLSKLPIDMIGIMWSSGFETYDIYNVDALINHFKCLKYYSK